MAEHLVVQGLADPSPHLPHLAALSGCREIAPIVPGRAYRLLHAGRHDGIQTYCAEHHLDGAFVATHLRLADFKLAAFDMDGTLIRNETLDELAELIGKREQIARLTAAAMGGEMDFYESFSRRVEQLAGVDEPTLARVWMEKVALQSGARELIAALRASGIHTMLITSGFRFFAHRLQAKLGLDEVICNDVELVDGKLSGKLVGQVLDARGKETALFRAMRKLGLEQSQVMALGDGANDLAMLEAAGAGIAFHAKPVLRRASRYTIDYVGLDGVANLFGP